MAQVQMDELIDHLRTEVKKALADAFAETAPDADVDIDNFYHVFKRRVYHHCNVWEQVPDQYVNKG